MTCEWLLYSDIALEGVTHSTLWLQVLSTYIHYFHIKLLEWNNMLVKLHPSIISLIRQWSTSVDRVCDKRLGYPFHGTWLHFNNKNVPPEAAIPISVPLLLEHTLWNYRFGHPITVQYYTLHVWFTHSNTLTKLHIKGCLNCDSFKELTFIFCASNSNRWGWLQCWTLK